MGARFKKAGAHLDSEPIELSVVDTKDEGEMDAYERLLGEAMEGDATLFARQDAVEAAWAIVQPILGSSTPLHLYEPGSWGPPEADRLATDVGGWHSVRGGPGL
jgi:glucose-6-phosphate 1-dehydrogenase